MPPPLLTYDQAKCAYFTILIISFAISGITNWLFYLNRKQDIIRKRGFGYSMMSSLALFVLLIACMHNLAFLNPFLDQAVPCWARLVLFYISWPPYVLLVIVQRFNIIMQYFNSQLINSAKTMNDMDRLQRTFLKISQWFNNRRIKTFHTAANSQSSKLNLAMFNRSNTIKEPEKEDLTFIFLFDNWLLAKISIAVFISSGLFLYLTNFTSDIDWSFYAAPVNLPEGTQCLELNNLWPLLALSIILTIVSINFTRVIKRMKDLLFIYKEIQIITILVNLLLPTFCLFHSLNALQHFKLQYGSFIFLYILFVLLQLVRSLYPLYAIRKLNQDQKYFSPDEKSFIATLNDAEMYKELVSSVKAELSIENTLFLEHCYLFYQRYKHALTYNGHEINLSHAIKDFDVKVVNERSFNAEQSRLYMKFIARGSDYELNIPSKLADDLKEAIERGENSLAEIDAVKNEVVEMLYANSYTRMVKTKASK